MFLVYEKNYLTGGDTDCVEECDMQLFTNRISAVKEIKRRKESYSKENFNFKFVEEESSENCYVFAESYDSKSGDRDGEFHICIVELAVYE